MAASTLVQDFASIRRDVGRSLFGGNKRDPANWSAQDTQDVTDLLRDGYSLFLYPPIEGPRGSHQWNFLQPVTTLTVWPTQTGTLTGTPSYNAGTGLSTITAVTGTFYPSMVDRAFTFNASGNDYNIAAYVSSSSITLDGDASGEGAAQAWTVTNTGDFALPDEFGSLNGTIIVQDLNSLRTEIRPRDMTDILRHRHASIRRGLPLFFGIIPRPTFRPTRGQFFDLALYPVPDRIYTLLYRGEVQPDVITATNKYAVGGMPYSRALKEAALACAELQQNGSYGPHYQSFVQAIATAIDFDRKQSSAESVGFNTNRSRCGMIFGRHAGEPLVTYNGVLYTGNSS